jgi:transcriptional regulator with XRE-family HTH domain
MSLPTTGRVMAEAPMADAEDTMPGAAKKRPARGRDLVDVHIGYRIRKRRLMLGMSQSALGQSLDVSFQTVQKWEGGAVRITVSMLLRMAPVLNVPFDYFLDGLPADRLARVGVGAGRRALPGSRRGARLKGDEWLALRAMRPLLGLPPKVRDEVLSHIRGLLRALEKE